MTLVQVSVLTRSSNTDRADQIDSLGIINSPLGTIDFGHVTDPHKKKKKN